MIFKLFEALLPERGIFYDNTTEKGQGTYITLTSANVEFCGDHIWISNDDWLFYGIQLSYEQVQQIVDNQFIEEKIDLMSGSIVFKLNENYYRLYDDRGQNWVRVSRENLISVLQDKKGAYGEINPKYTDPDEGVYLTHEDFH